MNKKPKIETERLVLTWPTSEQIEQYYSDIKDSKMFDTIIWDGPSSSKDLHDYWEECSDFSFENFDEDLHLALIDKSENKYIGGAAIRPIERNRNNLDTGYALAPKYHGNGYATEAVKALIDLAFRDREAERIIANIFVGNVASKKVVEKVGFSLEGTQRRAVKKRNEWIDEWLMAMTRTDWDDLQ